MAKKKATAPKAPEAPKAPVTKENVLVREGYDAFNGKVAIWEDSELKQDDRYWVEGERQDVVTDYLTESEATAKYEELVADASW